MNLATSYGSFSLMLMVADILFNWGTPERTHLQLHYHLCLNNNISKMTWQVYNNLSSVILSLTRTTVIATKVEWVDSNKVIGKKGVTWQSKVGTSPQFKTIPARRMITWVRWMSMIGVNMKGSISIVCTRKRTRKKSRSSWLITNGCMSGSSSQIKKAIHLDKSTKDSWKKNWCWKITKGDWLKILITIWCLRVFGSSSMTSMEVVLLLSRTQPSIWTRTALRE